MSDTPNAPAAPAAPAPAGDASDHDQPQGNEAPASAPAKKKAPQYRKIKVGDQEVSLSDEDIARDYSKWKGADAKFREAAEARKSVDAFMKQLQEDPEAVLGDKRLPIDRKKLAEKWLMEQIEAELKPADPRDEKLSAAEKRLKEYEDRDKSAKEVEEKAAYTKELETRKTAIGKTLSDAMQATHLSAHPETAAAVLREMATYMRAAKERGEDVTPDELVEHIHNSRFQQFYTLANQFEGDELIEFLGDEVVSRIRKADLARLRAGRQQGQTHRSESGQFESRNNASKSPKMDSFAAMKHAKKMMGDR